MSSNPGLPQSASIRRPRYNCRALFSWNTQLCSSPSLYLDSSWVPYFPCVGNTGGLFSTSRVGDQRREHWLLRPADPTTVLPSSQIVPHNAQYHSHRHSVTLDSKYKSHSQSSQCDLQGEPILELHSGRCVDAALGSHQPASPTAYYVISRLMPPTWSMPTLLAVRRLHTRVYGLYSPRTTRVSSVLAWRVFPLRL